MFNAFAFLKCSKKCQGNVQKPGLSASGDNVFFYFFFVFVFSFTVVDVLQQCKSMLSF